VEVVVTNLDANGDPIPTESVVTKRAYEYQRSPIHAPRDTKANQIWRQVIREVAMVFQRQVVPNVALGTSVDFGDRGQIIIKEAELPNAVLVGPRISEDFDNRHHWNNFIDEDIGGSPKQFETKWPGWVGTIEFDVVLATNKRRELYAMMQGLIEMFQRTPFLLIPVTLGDLNGPQHEFPFHLTSPPLTDLQDPNSDLSTAVSTFQVRQVPFRLDEPVALNDEVLLGQLETHHVTGTTVEVVPFADED
jgi:hypothetical protein